MSKPRSDQLFRTALLVFGLVFIFGIWPLMKVWPAGWQWQPAQPEYEVMLLGVYATLGVFLVMASRAPENHRSLIQFAAWSSLVHAGIMAVQVFNDSTESGHLIGDVPVLALVGIVLLVLSPRAGRPSEAS
jgi:MFS superfamily sulfate permease-like transporter